MNERQRGPESMAIVDHSKMQAKLEVGKQVDVIEMKKELGKTRENLATVRRIQQYLSQQRALKSRMRIYLDFFNFNEFLP